VSRILLNRHQRTTGRGGLRVGMLRLRGIGLADPPSLSMTE